MGKSTYKRALLLRTRKEPGKRKGRETGRQKDGGEGNNTVAVKKKRVRKKSIGFEGKYPKKVLCSETLAKAINQKDPLVETAASTDCVKGKTRTSHTRHRTDYREKKSRGENVTKEKGSRNPVAV